MNELEIDSDKELAAAHVLPSSESLEAFALALRLLGMAFYLPPTKQFLCEIGSGDLLTEWPIGLDEPETGAGLRLLHRTLNSKKISALLPAVYEDYLALFVGPGHVSAPPWESVYLSHDHLLFDEQTAQVREAYARFGLQIPRIDREPDDHIGFELLFLSHLAGTAANSLENSDTPEALCCLAAARNFLYTHPQKWVALFSQNLDKHACTDYYRGLGQLLLGSLSALGKLLPSGATKG